VLLLARSTRVLHASFAAPLVCICRVSVGGQSATIVVFPLLPAGGALVFRDPSGRALTAQAVRREFTRICENADLEGSWTPRELRHSFVSILSDGGTGIEVIARMVGHSNTTTTETVYRHQLRPVT
jgi:integrase